HFDPAKRIHKDDFTCLGEVARLTSLALDSARLYNTARVEIATRAEIEMQLRGAYEKLDNTYDTTLEGWARALDLRDCETEGHSRRVASVAVAMARIMKLPEDQLIHIWRGALLHDIGKLGVPDSILLKPASLTEEEWQIMRLHPIYGYDWLLPIEYLKPSLAIPRSHHERWDGTGYPDRLRGEAIPLQARIFAPIDVWDALSSNRPYRRSWPADKIREHIRSLAGSHFDPAVVEIFLSLPPSALVLQERSPYKIPF
ncbi:MAG: rpfG 1, partial [Firmicutes bacterium]|nr:rpfG 1 [Bacillota bacterium]